MKKVLLGVIGLGLLSVHTNYAQSEWTAKDRQLFMHICKKVAKPLDTYTDKTILNCFQLKMEHKYPLRKDFIAKNQKHIERVIKDKITLNAETCLKELAQDHKASLGWNDTVYAFIKIGCMRNYYQETHIIPFKNREAYCDCITSSLKAEFPNFYRLTYIMKHPSLHHQVKKDQDSFEKYKHPPKPAKR